MATIQSIKNKIIDFKTRVGLFAIGKIEFFELLNDFVDKIQEMTYYKSVKDFGAVGDGIADDTIAIQNAIDVVSAKNGTCYIPCGTYKITDTLLIQKSIWLKGENSEGVIIDIVSNTQKPAIKLNFYDESTPWGKFNGGGISDISIECHRLCDGILIDINNPSSHHRGVYENIKIVNPKIGFKGISDGGNALYLCIFKNIVIEGWFGQYGFYFNGGCYNIFDGLSADMNEPYGNSTAIAFSFVQQGGTFINLSTDGVGYFVIDGGSLTNYVCETKSTGFRSYYALFLDGNFDVKNISFFGLKKAEYDANWAQISGCESAIMLGVQRVNISNVIIGQVTNLAPIYPFALTSGGSGIIQNVYYKDFTSNGLTYNLLEVYVSAENLQKYKFLGCDSITKTSNLGSNVVDALPVATDKLRFTQLILKGSIGVSDNIYVCVKNATNTYEWTKLN